MVKRLRRRKWMQRMLRRRIVGQSCWWRMRRWIAPLPRLLLDRHFDCSCYCWWSYNQFQTCNHCVDCRPKRRIDQSLYLVGCCYGISNGDVRSESVAAVVGGIHRWRCYCHRRPVQRQKTHRSGLCLFSSWWSG